MKKIVKSILWIAILYIIYLKGCTNAASYKQPDNSIPTFIKSPVRSVYMSPVETGKEHVSKVQFHVAVDASGSVDEKNIESFFNQSAQIFGDYPVKMYLFGAYCEDLGDTWKKMSAMEIRKLRKANGLESATNIIAATDKLIASVHNAKQEDVRHIVLVVTDDKHETKVPSTEQDIQRLGKDIDSLPNTSWYLLKFPSNGAFLSKYYKKSFTIVPVNQIQNVGTAIGKELNGILLAQDFELHQPLGASAPKTVDKCLANKREYIQNKGTIYDNNVLLRFAGYKKSVDAAVEPVIIHPNRANDLAYLVFELRNEHLFIPANVLIKSLKFCNNADMNIEVKNLDNNELLFYVEPSKSKWIAVPCEIKSQSNTAGFLSAISPFEYVDTPPNLLAELEIHYDQVKKGDIEQLSNKTTTIEILKNRNDYISKSEQLLYITTTTATGNHSLIKFRAAFSWFYFVLMLFLVFVCYQLFLRIGSADMKDWTLAIDGQLFKLKGQKKLIIGGGDAPDYSVEEAAPNHLELRPGRFQFSLLSFADRDKLIVQVNRPILLTDKKGEKVLGPILNKKIILTKGKRMNFKIEDTLISIY